MSRSAEWKPMPAIKNLPYDGPDPKVLVAGMNATMRNHIARALAQDGYRVGESVLDDTLLRRVDTHQGHGDPVEVVILDMTQLPDRGLDLLEAVRQVDWALRVILLMKEDDSGLQQEAARLGANATLTEPFDVDDLRTVVLNVASRF